MATASLSVQFSAAEISDGRLSWEETAQRFRRPDPERRMVGLILRHRKLRAGERFGTFALNGDLFQEHSTEFGREELVALSGSAEISTRYPVWGLEEAVAVTPMVTRRADGTFVNAPAPVVTFDGETGELRCSAAVWGGFRVRYRTGTTFFTWLQDRTPPASQFGETRETVFLTGHVFARLGGGVAAYEIEPPIVEGEGEAWEDEAYRVESEYLACPPDSSMGRPGAVELPEGWNPPEQIYYPGKSRNLYPDPEQFFRLVRVHELGTVRQANSAAGTQFQVPIFWPFSTDTSYRPKYRIVLSGNQAVWDRVNREWLVGALLDRYPGAEIG